MAAAQDLETLQNLKITHILTLGGLMDPEFPEKFEYKVMEIIDEEDFDYIAHFDEAIEFVNKGVTEGAVLVHWYAGVSRSATLVIAYLIKMNKMTYQEAHDFVKSKRCIIQCFCKTEFIGFAFQIELFQY